MYVNVNNCERPDFGETAKTTSRRLLQRYFAIIFTNNIKKFNMHIQITRRVRSIVDTVIEVASSNPVTVPCYFIFLTLFFLSIIYLAVACDFQQCGILTCVNSDEPVQPPFKLRQFGSS